MLEIEKSISLSGYSFIPGSFYEDLRSSENLKKMQKSYEILEKDIYSKGNRYRAYKKYEWDDKNNVAIQSENKVYHQSLEYNQVDGGKLRNFVAIHNDFLINPIFQTLLQKDIEIATNTIIDFSKKTDIGIHQIRYLAEQKAPAYSSPLWLHKDDEEMVFIHLFNISSNIVGGDLIISPDKSLISDVIFLEKSLDTVVVTKNHYHALTPVGSNNSNMAFRDILLITFSSSD